MFYFLVLKLHNSTLRPRSHHLRGNGPWMALFPIGYAGQWLFGALLPGVWMDSGSDTDTLPHHVTPIKAHHYTLEQLSWTTLTQLADNCDLLSLSLNVAINSSFHCDFCHMLQDSLPAWNKQQRSCLRRQGARQSGLWGWEFCGPNCLWNWELSEFLGLSASSAIKPHCQVFHSQTTLKHLPFCLMSSAAWRSTSTDLFDGAQCPPNVKICHKVDDVRVVQARAARERRNIQKALKSENPQFEATCFELSSYHRSLQSDTCARKRRRSTLSAWNLLEEDLAPRQQWKCIGVWTFRVTDSMYDASWYTVILARQVTKSCNDKYMRFPTQNLFNQRN